MWHRPRQSPNTSNPGCTQLTSVNADDDVGGGTDDDQPNR